MMTIESRRGEPGPISPARTALIGREREVAQLRSLLLDARRRLVTLTGPGGVGKTRLALAAAAAVADAFPAGAILVSLAPVREHSQVVAAISSALALPDGGSQPPLDRLIAGIGSRRLLLVLDNFEQVAGAAPLVKALLLACPALAIVATSRAPLRLSGEQEFPVPPLALPDSGELPPLDRLAGYAAVALFLQRGRSINPGLQLNDTNAPAIVEVCRRLGGLPLAIELAAARVRLLPPRELLARLDRGLELLADGPRDAPTRQRTIRDTIAWSESLLGASEQRLFRRLAIFAGGWTLDAAERVVPWDDVTTAAQHGYHLLAGVTALVDSSLVSVSPVSAGGMRYAMPDVVREYALERLAASGEVVSLGDRFIDWVIEHAPGAWSDQADAFVSVSHWAPHLIAEETNVRAALERLAEQPDRYADFAGLAHGLTWYWMVRGAMHEGLDWLQRALDAAGDASPHLRLRLRSAIAHLLHGIGDDERALTRLTEDIPVARGSGDAALFVADAILAGLLLQERGDTARAGALLDEALATAERAGLQPAVAHARMLLALVAVERGQLDFAYALVDHALTGFRELGSEGWGIGNALEIAGVIALARGDPAGAVALFQASIRELGSYHDAVNLSLALSGLAAAIQPAGNAEAVATLAGFVDAVRERTGIVPYLPERALLAHAAAAAHRQLGAARAATAALAGRRMFIEEAVAFALQLRATGTARDRAASTGADSLSAREREVLRLLVEGQSNQQIAAALFISPNTAANHVARILDKLGVSSRTAAATWATRHGID